MVAPPRAPPPAHPPFVARVQLADFVPPAKVNAPQPSESTESERGDKGGESERGERDEREGERRLLEAAHQLYVRHALTSELALQVRGTCSRKRRRTFCEDGVCEQDGPAEKVSGTSLGKRKGSQSSSPCQRVLQRVRRQ